MNVVININNNIIISSSSIFFFIIIIIIIKPKKTITFKIEQKSNEAENEKLFSVFCLSSVIRTPSLVIIIIITIITIIVISIYFVSVVNDPMKDVCLSELPMRFIIINITIITIIIIIIIIIISSSSSSSINKKGHRRRWHAAKFSSTQF